MKNNDEPRKAVPSRDSYQPVEFKNEMYERFYKESGLVPEEEFPVFWASLKRTLPTTFRFTGSKTWVHRDCPREG